MSNHCKEEIAATHWGRSRLTVSVIRKEINPCASEHICEETAAPVNQAGANKAQQCAVDTEMLTMFSRPMPIRHSAGCWRRATPRALRSRRCAGNCGNTTSRSPAGSSRCPHRSTFPRSLSSHYLQIAVFVLALTLQCSSARTSGSKRPLITTDATRSPDFRTFMQGVVDERPSGRSLGAPDSLNDAESLDFQTLKVIKRWGNTTNVLLVSGRDYVYMLDSKYSTEQPQINYLERLTWRTPKKSQRECHLMGKKEYECQNFIRVVELMDDGRLMVCGTNAYTPACRYYKREQFNEPSEDVDSLYQSESMCRGQCVVPFNPATASATLYTNTDNGYQIFTAVVNDFLSNEPTILRKATPTLFSNRHWLNEPTFLKILEYGDKVYVFFRETAKESESGSSEEITYARVAQICKNDQGGLNVLAQQWTSFLKARLRCGYSNRGHLQFNNMTSVSEIVTVNDRGESDDVILATFTTPWEWEDASLSAVCAFSMKDIIRVFEVGQFLGEIELDAKPLHKPEMPFNGGPSYSPQNSVKKIMRSYPVSRSEQPETRPGSCAKMQTSPNVLYFAKEHPLMYDVINPYTLSPIFVTFNNVRATQIAVDNNAGDNGHLMIYIGTEDGKVLRLRGMLTADKGPKAVLLESIMVGMKENCELGGCGIRSLHVSRSPRVSDSTPSAFVAFTDHMVQFPLMRCNLYKSSRCCSTDPDCGWDRSGCVQRTYANRFDLSETLKDVGDIPESCDVTSGKPNGDGKVPMGTDGGTDLGLLVCLFFIGMLFGILITLAIVCGCRRQSRRRKLTINKSVICKSMESIDSANNRQDNVSETSAARPDYLDMSKGPQQQTKKYSLPPSPSPSDGGHDVGFANGNSGRKGEDLRIDVNVGDEETPLVVELPESPSNAVKAAPPIPAKQSQKSPAKKDEASGNAEPQLSSSGWNPNSNNSNNVFCASDDPSPPALPAKELSGGRALENYIAPLQTQPTSDVHPLIGEKRPSIKKFQSFGGYDRPKPPVPTKSPALIKSLTMKRPQSLAPPTTINRIEEIQYPPRPQPRQSQTPPIVRSYQQVPYKGAAPPAPIIIPKRRERPPSFRHNSMAPKAIRSPVAVNAPVVPGSDAGMFK